MDEAEDGENYQGSFFSGAIFAYICMDKVYQCLH